VLWRDRREVSEILLFRKLYVNEWSGSRIGGFTTEHKAVLYVVRSSS
jgi:hypothetical protein